MQTKNRTFNLGKIKINDTSPVIIITEIGINHAGSLNEAYKLVDLAKKNGSKIIKVQIHIPDEEMSKEAKKIKPGNSDDNIFNVIANNSLNLTDELKLKNYIEKKKLFYLATPFSFAAVDWLIKNKIKAFKIGSGECSNFPLIKYIAKFKKPMVVSTGMHSLEQVRSTVKLLKKLKCNFALLHCTNLYPTKIELSRLNRLLALKQIFKDIIVGYSDHSIGTEMSKYAVALGAKIVEKHFVKSKRQKGPDVSCSMDPNDLREMITEFKKISSAIKFNVKNDLIKEESVTRKFALHSVVSKMKIKKGEKLNYKNLTIKRPGTGNYKSNQIYGLIGKIAKKEIKQNTQIKKIDVK